MIYMHLFFSFLQIGLFSIGGGYAALPLIQHQVVEQNRWLSMGEFTDLLTISQMTPGPIAINGATFVGMQIAGIPGAIAATSGCVLPSFVIVLLLAVFYKKYGKSKFLQGILTGLRPVVVVLIAVAGIDILNLVFIEEAGSITDTAGINVMGIALFGAALYGLRKWKLSPVLVMGISGVAGIILYEF